MGCKFRVAMCLLAALLLWAPPLPAQLQLGNNLGMDLGGTVAVGYSGSYGDTGISAHGMDVGGQGFLNGHYYNPNFISFNLQPYYNRSQNNSDSASIFDSSGVTGTANIFGGSHFPGTVSFNKLYNSTGQYGIPGTPGLSTDGRSQAIGITWSSLLPDLPTLTVGYSRYSGASSLLGSTAENDSSGQTFSVRSSYNKLAGFSLGGGFVRQTNDSTSPAALVLADETHSSSESNSYQFFAGHKLPLKGYLNTQFTRTNYGTESSTGSTSGATDTAVATLNFVVGKLPITTSATYTDNLFGSLQQSILSNGGTLLLARNVPVSRSLNLSTTTTYTVWKISLSGYVNRIQQFSDGMSYGGTQFGCNASYHFVHHWLKGLTVSAGMVDTANKEGNLWTGFVANANYVRYLAGFELGGNFGYDQNTQTLLNIYTTSTLRYGGSIRRRLRPRMVWSGSFTGGHSGLVRQAGNSTRSEGFYTTLSWRGYSASAFYSQSSGASVLTSNGLVALPVPEPLIPINALSLYNARARGFAATATPRRNLTIVASYSRSNNGTLSPVLISRSGSNMMNGRATYRFRKMYFNTGFTRFQQFISSSATGPAMVTSYYFGISRWFNFF